MLKEVWIFLENDRSDQIIKGTYVAVYWFKYYVSGLGNAEELELWKQFRDLSIEKYKEIYEVQVIIFLRTLEMMLSWFSF